MTPLYVGDRVLLMGYLSGCTTPWVEWLTLKITNPFVPSNDYSCPLIDTCEITPGFKLYLKRPLYRPIGSIRYSNKRFSYIFARFGKTTTGLMSLSIKELSTNAQKE